MKPDKSTVNEIRRRFDADVERFSNLETGQVAAQDGRLALELIAQAAAHTAPGAASLLDIGCGAGNYSLRLLQLLPGLQVTLLDLSQPMLTRARQRLQPAARGEVTCLQGDVRQAAFEEQAYDIILAAAVFHHLRGEQEWRAVFAKCYKALRPGGWLWIYDMIEHDTPAVQSLMQARYGEYLADQKDEAYRDQVFAIIEREDSPRALLWQIHLLKETGFSQVEILHKNSLFAAFGAKRESG